MKHIHKRPVSTLFADKNGFPFSGFLWGLAVYAALMLASAFISDSASVMTTISDKGWMLLLLTAIPYLIGFCIQGSAEEILLRGYVPQILTRGLGRPFLALIIPAIVFALLHVGYGLHSFLNAAMFAVFATFIVLSRGNLAEICGAHAANNFMIVWLLSDLQAASQSQGWSVDLNDIAHQIIIFVLFIVIMRFRNGKNKSKVSMSVAKAIH